MKQTKKRLSGMLAAVMWVSALTGCAASPDKAALTSKNDGVFQQNMTAAATAPLDEKILCTDTFTSHDGTTEYTFCLDQELISDPLPVVEVVPHFFSGEEVQHICQVLLGDAQWREQVHEKDPKYSKGELQKKLKWMTEIANADALGSLFPEETSSNGYDFSDEIDTLKRYMQYYTVLLETAPEEDPRQLCDWTYRDESLYVSPSYGNAVIHATAHLGDIEYYVYGVRRDKKDYKLSAISLGVGNNRDYLDKEYYYSQLLRTEEPTQAQIDAAAQKAQSMLDQMGVGQWKVSHTQVYEERKGGGSQYRIHVMAVPVLNGTPAFYKQPIEDLTSKEANAANYHPANVLFSFSANGDLINFEMQSPIDTVQVINDGAAILPVAELMANAKAHLSLTGLEETRDYPLLSLYYETPVTCCVTVDRIEFGLIRIKAADKDFVYDYAPAIAVYATTQYYDKGTGDPVDCIFVRNPKESSCLFWINAIDGSIIP